MGGITRTIEIADINPVELAQVFCGMWAEEQAQFFAEINAIAGDIKPEGRSVIEKLAEHVLGYDELVAAVVQYRDDLRYPPAADSVERRLEMIRAILAKVQG